MSRNPCHGWAQADRVSFLKPDGTVRATGKVLIRKSAAGKWYLQVRLMTAGSGLGSLGDLLWPEGWIWGEGQYRAVCFECSQTFLTADLEVARHAYCPPCERREEKARKATDSGVRNHRGFMHGAANAPAPVRQPTPEEIEATRRQKLQDELESPF